MNDEKSIQFFQSHNITSCSSGRGQIMFGDNKGDVHVMDRSLNTRKCLVSSHHDNEHQRIHTFDRHMRNV